MVTTMPIPEPVIFAAYQERMERRRRESASVQNYAYHARRYALWASARALDVREATTDDLECYFAEMDFSPGTMRNHLKSLRAAYRYAQRRGIVDSDPTLEVTIPDEDDSEPVIVPLEQLRAIRDGCRDAEDLALFTLLAYTGMRRIEVRRLRWEHVNFKRATVTVVKGKGRKLRHVPMHPVVAEVLGDLPFNLMNHVIPGRHGGELADGTLHYRLRRIGLTTAHDFRRTVASSLYRNGVPTDSIDKILGWSPRVVRTRYYVNFAQDDLQAAILRLYADNPL